MTPARRRLRRGVRIGLAVLLAAVIVLALDTGALYGRVGRFEYAAPPGSPGTTYLIVGSDARAGAPHDQQATFGTTAMMPGARADVVLVVHVPAGGRPSVLAVPRDLVVFADGSVPRRLTVTLLGGPQATADALCRSLGIAVDHIVVLGFGGFERLVDSAGGVTVDVPRPVRDRYTGLRIDTPGPHHLDGRTALAYVRSRHAEENAGDGWAPVAEGAAGRPGQALTVLRAVAGSLRPTDPVRSQRVAWAAAGAVSVDASMGPRGLARLGLALRSVGPADTTVLPAATTDTPIPMASLDTGAGRALRALAGGGCSPMLLDAPRAATVVSS
ncbi:MAG TPA: LCP family protein [Acidimicrobiales bacterium]|nr:LCP family protein [Acidimicrobiales bacterium]